MFIRVSLFIVMYLLALSTGRKTLREPSILHLIKVFPNAPTEYKEEEEDENGDENLGQRVIA